MRGRRGDGYPRSIRFFRLLQSHDVESKLNMRVRNDKRALLFCRQILGGCFICSRCRRLRPACGAFEEMAVGDDIISPLVLVYVFTSIIEETAIGDYINQPPGFGICIHFHHRGNDDQSPGFGICIHFHQHPLSSFTVPNDC